MLSGNLTKSVDRHRGVVESAFVTSPLAHLHHQVSARLHILSAFVCCALLPTLGTAQETPPAGAGGSPVPVRENVEEIVRLGRSLASRVGKSAEV